MLKTNNTLLIHSSQIDLRLHNHHFLLNLIIIYIHEIWTESMNKGAECQAIPPAGCHIVYGHVWISICELSRPSFQSEGSWFGSGAHLKHHNIKNILMLYTVFQIIINLIIIWLNISWLTLNICITWWWHNVKTSKSYVGQQASKLFKVIQKNALHWPFLL